jgi:SNF2 family DNA or RNA helicase
MTAPAMAHDACMGTGRMTNNFAACPYPPTKHQLVGIQKIVNEPYVFVTDEMGFGKTKQLIDAAHVLFQQDKIDRVLVICPAPVKHVWHDPELGQLSEHAWSGVHNHVELYHKRPRAWHTGPADQRALHWIITNYEFIRMGLKSRSRYLPDRLVFLQQQCGPRTLLVLDESSAVKNARALQTRACMYLRKECTRVVLMSGTPIAHSPLDLLSQGNLLHPSILSDRPGEYTNLIQFRNRYATMGGFQYKQIVEWRNLDDLQQRFAPHTLRRLKKDCLDLPPKLKSVTLTATLTPATWKLYKKMRDDMIVWLQDDDVSVAQQAITKVVRLAQLTSGHLGGLEIAGVEKTSSEKLDLVIEWVQEQLDLDPHFKAVIWSRFRYDVDRLAEGLEALPVTVGKLWGGNSTADREATLSLLHPHSAKADEAAIVVGTQSTGSMGITLAAAATVVYVSNDFSLNVRVQSEDRNHRPGQTRPVSYFDVVATGPDGQKTIDHLVLKALRKKQNLADLTASAWVDALQQE